MAVSQNSVYINQEMCYIMIFSMKKMKVVKNWMFFVALNNIGFHIQGKACKTELRFVMKLLQNPPLCSNIMIAFQVRHWEQLIRVLKKANIAKRGNHWEQI